MILVGDCTERFDGFSLNLGGCQGIVLEFKNRDVRNTRPREIVYIKLTELRSQVEGDPVGQRIAVDCSGMRRLYDDKSRYYSAFGHRVVPVERIAELFPSLCGQSEQMCTSTTTE